MNMQCFWRRLSLVGAFVLGASATEAHAATYTVSNLNDSGAGSLRQAIQKANAKFDADTIVFASNVRGTIALASELTLSEGVTITGPGAKVLTLSGQHKTRLFNVSNSISTISGLTLTQGSAPFGGAIFNQSSLNLNDVLFTDNQAIGAPGEKGTTGDIGGPGGMGTRGETARGGAICNIGTLTIRGATFAGNSVRGGDGGAGGDGGRGSAGPDSIVPGNGGTGGTSGLGQGGAIYDSTAVYAFNVTFFGNTANTGVGGRGGKAGRGFITNGRDGDTGAIGVQDENGYNGSGVVYSVGRMTLDSCTVCKNTVQSNVPTDGAVYSLDGSQTFINNTIVLGNTGGNVAKPVSGNNIIGGTSSVNYPATKVFGAPIVLKDNGGPTPTVALVAGSPAIDKGDTVLKVDQRGLPRPQDGSGKDDVGAFEVQGPTPTATPLPVVSVNSPSVTEGDGGAVPMNFTLKLSRASAQKVTLVVNTGQGTATANEDYVPIYRRVVTFAPGQTSQTVTVPVKEDNIQEENEFFSLVLREPSGATVGPNGVGIIIDNDGPPIVSVNDFGIREGDSGTKTVSANVLLSARSLKTVTVRFTMRDKTAVSTSKGSSGNDYVARSGTLTFAPGETSKSIEITINGDTIPEDSEQFVVAIFDSVNATLGRAIGTGTILNDDGPPKSPAMAGSAKSS